MKTAIVHDWIPVIAGAEKVLEQILKLYPDADVFTLFDFASKDNPQIFGKTKITTSYLNRLPKVDRYYRKLLPFCPQAVEDFDLSAYDLIISSSHAVAKGVITGPDQIHISYIHSPARYAWDLTHEYLRQSNLDKGFRGYFAKSLLHKFRMWDARTANGVDHFIANSEFIAKRVSKIYGRTAEVIYPPVDVKAFTMREEKEDFYLAASRQVPYKRIDLIVKAFTQMPDKKLVVIGDGPEHGKISYIVSGHDNIELKGYLGDDALKDYMGRAKAFVFAAREDFGIIPVEAQACGTPVIAFGAGGALETVVDAKTGLFFKEQTEKDICDAVKRFECLKPKINAKDCRKNADNFAADIFRGKLQKSIESAIAHNSKSHAA